MTRKLFQKYDEETKQWLLQDIHDWSIDKFKIKADEGAEVAEVKRWLGELFKRYDEETQQWLLQDIRDWPIDKFKIKAGEGDGGWSGGLLGFIEFIGLSALLIIGCIVFACLCLMTIVVLLNKLSVLAGPVTASSQPKGMVL